MLPTSTGALGDATKVTDAKVAESAEAPVPGLNHDPDPEDQAVMSTENLPLTRPIREVENRNKELELQTLHGRALKLEKASTSAAQPSTVTASVGFDISKDIVLVPPFCVHIFVLLNILLQL